MRMTTQDELDRVYYVQDWPCELVERLKRQFVEAGTPVEDQLDRVRAISESQILSVLRDGDPALDLVVAQGFGFETATEMNAFVDSLEAGKTEGPPSCSM